MGIQVVLHFWSQACYEKQRKEKEAKQIGLEQDYDQETKKEKRKKERNVPEKVVENCGILLMGYNEAL